MNVMQVPGGKEFRNCFGQLEGWDWVSSDYSQQELRLAAKFHEVEVFQAFFTEGFDIWGDDFHSYAATLMERAVQNNPDLIVPPKSQKVAIEGVPKFDSHMKKLRGNHKMDSFGILYGMAPYTLAKRLGLDEEAGEKMFETFLDGLPGIRESFKKNTKLVLERGWIVLSPLTDKRYFFEGVLEQENLPAVTYEKLGLEPMSKVSDAIKGNWSEKELSIWKDCWKVFFKNRGVLERRSKNLPLQGRAADMLKVFLCYFYDWRWESGLQDEIYPVLPAHDESNAICLNKHRDLTIQKQEEFMIKAGYRVEKGIPMDVETGVGASWIH